MLRGVLPYTFYSQDFTADLMRYLPFCLVLLLAACETPATETAEPATTSDAPAQVRPITAMDVPDAVLAPIDVASARAHIEYLSSDELEGRGTGTPGEEKAVAYIAAHMEEAGLEPAGENGTYFQAVPLLGSTPTPQGPLTLTHEDGTAIEMDFITDYIVSTDLETTEVSTSAELVFVGYGIDAPGYNWNSFKDVDVTDKILVSFVNDPIATEDDPNLFQGDTLTYYGRWTYKQEEARRRGAKGVLLIHTLQTAGYPFTVLSNSASGEQIQLATPPENPLEMKGWITRGRAEELAQMAGSTLDDWFFQANSRDFQPVELPVTASIDVDYAVRTFEGTNVAGKIVGAARPNESVIYTAHHDHLGIGQADGEGDQIYNGAVDNASGVSMLLELVTALTQAATPPERTIVFLSVSAEESGLLGAQYYARNPHLPLGLTAGNINVDSGNVLGETSDIVGIGAEKSEMMALLRATAAEEGMTVTPDPQPNQGLFFRSDQLAFARAGVPAVFVNTGTAYIGQPEEYAGQVKGEYRAQRYHQPADEYDPAWPLTGLVQQTRVAARMGYQLAYSTLDLSWNEGEAFAQARAESRAALD